MSSKTKTESTNQYNQPSMNAFNTLTPQAQGVMSGYMSDPFNQNGGNPFYNLALQQGLKANQTMNQGAISNLTRNMTASGFGGGNMPGFMQSQLATQGRANSAMNSNTFLNNAFNAQQLQGQYTSMAANYKPLQTGQTQTQTTSGVGTWLPALIGAGMQGAGAFFSGGATLGLSSLARAGIGAGASFGGSLLSNMSKPSMSSGYGGYNGSGASVPSMSGAGGIFQLPSANPGLAYNPLAYSGANPFLMGGH